jgi:hypothetical protein
MHGKLELGQLSPEGDQAAKANPAASKDDP